MPKYTYLTGNQANNIFNSLILENTYKEAAYWLGQGSKYNLTKFLQLKKAEANNTSTAADENGQAKGDVTESIYIGAPEEEKLIGTDGVEILKQAMSEAAKKTMQMYIDSYMAPIGNTDIKYRLGKVTGIKNTVAVYDENDVESIRKEYDKDNIITDNLGRIYTRTNLEASFSVNYWSDKSSSVKSMNIPYVNLYFPPYKIPDTLKNLDQWNNALSAWENLVKYGTFKASEPTFNLSTLKNSRGDFTYRTPAFKSINDNIIFLQYILEQISGVVSTYLTDWDISMYLQEGLISDGTYNIGDAGAIWMLYRIRQDNPLAGTQDAIYYKDDRALAFGSVTAACSKLFGDNELLWVPNYYPLSTFWTPYWGVNDIWNENGDALKTPRQLTDEHILVKTTNGNTTGFLPGFYYPELGGTLNNYIDINDDLSFYQKVKLTDERNAALSGWLSWDCHSYSDILYSTPEDGLSDIDVTLQGIALKSKKIQSALKIIRSNVLDAGGVPLNEELFSNGDRAATLMSTSGGTAAGNNITASGSSSSGGGNMAAKLARYLLTGSKGSSGSSSTTDDMGEFDPNTTEGALNLASKNASGYADAGSLTDNLLSAPGSDSIKSNANTVGIPQNGPALFGGPHGAALSPRTPQAYFQVDNILMRNQPRLDCITDRHNNFVSDSGYGYGTRGYSNQDFYHAEGKEFGDVDQSPELAIHKLRNGLLRWNMSTCYSVQKYWDWFPGTIRTTWSPCSTYIDWPTQLNSAYITYPTYYDEDGNPVSTEIRWGWVTHYQPYTTDSGWFEGSYWWYSNENSYSSLIYRGNELYWRVESYGPHRYGYATQYVYKQYQRYKCGALPSVPWHVIETEITSYQAHYYSAPVLWFMNSFGWLLRNPWYLNIYTTGTKKAFRLHIPGNKYGTPYSLTAFHRVYNYDVSDGYTGNEQYLINYLKKEYPNNDGKMFFVQSDDSYSRFLNNGPNAIFEMPVWPATRAITYRTLHSKRHRCHRDYYWVSHATEVTYLEVDPLAVSTFFGDLQSEPYHGSKSVGINSFIDTIPDTYLRRTISPMQLMSYYQYSWSSLYANGPGYGMSGYGIYSFLPGIDNNVISDSQFESYSKLLTSNAISRNWANIRFRDIPMPAPVVKEWATSFYSTEDKCLVYNSNGFPKYTMQYMDKGIRKGIARAFTRSTFYDVNEKTYYVGFDASLKLLMNQLYWQISFLKHTKALFIDNVSWPVVRKLIDEFIDKSVSSVSKVGFNSRTQRYYYEETKFNYWIMKAEKYFPAAQQDQATQKSILIETITGRMSALETAVNSIKDMVSKPADQWTWNNIQTVYATIDTVRRKLSVSNLEEYVMAYLNVLYEYRKYFINLRFNKQDGTMWIMRQLESIIPQAVFANLNKQEVPDLSDISEDRMYGTYPVAFYDLTNSLSDKVKALSSDGALDEDRITTVYVKVKYTDFDAYEEDQDRIKRKVQSTPTVVYIEETHKYAELPVDGSYFLDSWERSDNWSKKKYNAAKLKANPAVNKDTLKTVKDYDETGPWYIKWGNEKSLTPIKFGIPAGINIGNMSEMLKSDTSSDAYTLACAGKNLADYWTVRLPSNAYPRTPGYRTKVKLKPWNPEIITDTSRFKADAESTVTGEFGYALWPITEAQGSMSQDDKSSTDYMNNMLKTFVQQTENS